MVINRVSAMSNLGNKGFIEVRSLNGIIFSQGMAFKTIPQHNPSQVRMVFKGNPKEIIDLPFIPIRNIPNGFHALNRFSLSDFRLDPQSQIFLHRIKKVDNSKTRGFRKKVQTAEVGEEVVLEIWV